MVQLLSPEWVELHGAVLGALPEVPGASARVQHVVSGGPDGEVAYSLDFVDGRVVGTTSGRDDEAADCSFLETFDDAGQLASGALDLHVAFMRGKVKMTGAMGPFMAVLACTQGEPYRAALVEIAAATTVA